VGKVLVDKRKVFASPRDSLRAGIALVPADRKGLGLDPEDRLAEHVVLPRLGPFQRRTRLHRREFRAEAAEWVERLDVQPPLLDRRMGKFSGGNQQKAVLARWLRTGPRVLLLDEPTQGVDVGAKAAIYHQIAEAAGEGVAVLIASSDAEELVHLCDRVIVLRAGMMSAELAGANLTVERLVAETLGATSDRKNLKVAREPVLFKVIRDEPDTAPEHVETPTMADDEAEPDDAAARGRMGTMFDRAVDKLRRKS
jgi:ribose transport system ATP-binding protein